MRQQLWFFFFLAVSALWAIASVWNNLRHGSFYIEPDSASYLSLAHNLACGHGYLHYDLHWSADWPPLIPFLLVVLIPLFPVPIQAFAALSAVCYGMTLFTAGRWLQARVSWQAGVAGVLVLLTSWPLRKVMNSALSEPLFILLTVTFLAQCERYRLQPEKRTLAAMTMLAALCSLTRYAGLVTIAVGAILIWQKEWERQKRERQRSVKEIARLVVFMLGASLPILAWCCLNRYRSGTFMGDRSPAAVTLAQTLGFVRDVGAQWSGGTIPLGMLCLTGVMGILFLRRRDIVSIETLNPWLLFSVVYLIFLVHSACSYEFDLLDNRLLSPLYIPLVLILVTLFDKCLFQSMHTGRKRVLGVSTLLLLAIVVWHNGSLNVNYNDRNECFTYAATHSSVIGYLQRSPTHDTYYSNDPSLYWFCLGRNVQWVPGINDAANPGNLSEILANAPPGSRLVWFLSDEEAADPEDRDKIKKTLTDSAALVLLAEFSNGLVYKIN